MVALPMNIDLSITDKTKKKKKPFRPSHQCLALVLLLKSVAKLEITAAGRNAKSANM